MRALNVVIRVEKDFNLRKRYAKVIWNREGVTKKPDGSPLIFYDEHGWWQGVPEQIDAALYGSVPSTVPSARLAVVQGVDAETSAVERAMECVG